MTATISTEQPRIKELAGSRGLYVGSNPEIVPVCPPVVEKVWTRRLNVSNYNASQLFIAEVGGELASITGSFSISSYTITANGTPVGIGDTITAGDLIDITILPRQASGTVDFAVTVVADTTKTDAASLYACRWTSIRNGTQIYTPQTIGGASTQAQIVPRIKTSGNTFGYSSDAVATVSFSGTGYIIMRGNDSGVEWGCGLLTTPTPTWPGLNLNAFRHGLYVTYGDDRVFSYENGTNPSSVNFSSQSRGVSPEYMWFKIEDTGSAIAYYYSTNAGSTWTLWYTSVQAYVPNRTWYIGVAGARLSPSVIGGVFLSSPNITNV